MLEAVALKRIECDNYKLRLSTLTNKELQDEFNEVLSVAKKPLCIAIALYILGVLLCLTIVGAIIGFPLILMVALWSAFNQYVTKERMLRDELNKRHIQYEIIKNKIHFLP